MSLKPSMLPGLVTITIDEAHFDIAPYDLLVAARALSDLEKERLTYHSLIKGS